MTVNNIYGKPLEEVAAEFEKSQAKFRVKRDPVTGCPIFRNVVIGDSSLDQSLGASVNWTSEPYPDSKMYGPHLILERIEPKKEYVWVINSLYENKVTTNVSKTEHLGWTKVELHK